MQVRCPECLQAIELSAENTLRKIDCPACGSSFNLVGDETVIGEGRTKSVSDESVRAIGHFSLTKEVGQGAFGKVWLAHDQELDRDVAIKIPRRGQLNGEEAERFFREARASAQLRHPNIVTVYEVGRDGDTIFVVSDFVTGVTLSEWLDGQQPTARESVQLCIKIADALHHAHEMGIVHRDLKPGNIMMDRDGEPHIMDFGLAKRDASEATLTLDGQILGTPAYMSPEQAKGEGSTADRRADVYSMGVVLFELLTGEVPFRGNIRMLIHQIINEEPPSPRKLNAKIAKDLETICLRCIQKSPSRRYQTAADIAADLRHWLNHEPITAKAIGPVERSWLWCRRNVAVSLLLLLGVSLLLGIAGVTTTAYFREVGFRKSVQNALGRESDALGKARSAQTDAEESEKRAVVARDDAVVARNDAVEQERLTRLQLYVSDMNRAPQAWELGSTGMLRGLLDRHIPAIGEPDNRGFEWYFWNNKSNESVWNVKLPPQVRSPYMRKPNRGHRKLVILRDDTQIALEGDYDDVDPGMRIHDTNTGKLVRIVEYPVALEATGETANARISDACNIGSQVIIALITVEDELILFNMTAERIQTSLKGISGRVISARFSDDGELLAVCLLDGTVQVHSVVDGKSICSFNISARDYGGGQRSYPWRLAFSPTARLLAVSSFGGGVPITIHDATSGKLQTSITAGSQYSIGAFTNREDRLVTISHEGRVSLWDLDGKKLLSSKQADTSSTRVIELSHDRMRVATASLNRMIQVWDSETLRHIATLRGHESNVKSIEFTKDGKFLYSRSPTELVKWDLDREGATSVLSTGKLPLRDLRVSSDGNTVAICSGTTAQISMRGDAQAAVVFNQRTPLTAGALSSNGKRFVSGGPKKLYLWEENASAATVLADVPLQPMALEFSTDGRWVVAGGGHALADEHDGYLVFVDLKSKEHWKTRVEHGAITGIESLGPNHILAMSYGRPGRISLWNLETRQIEKSILIRQSRAIDVSDTNAIAAVGQPYGEVQLYRIDSLELIGTLPSTGAAVVDLEFLPDGRTLAVADDTSDVKLWDMQSRQLVGTLTGHKAIVLKLASGKNPPRLFSASKDGEVRVWHGGP